jgi:transcriptional regulator with XRE-family HTH domain
MEVEDFKKDKFLKDLGAQIAKVRKQKGFSQDRLGLEAGLARGTVSKIENAEVEAKAGTLALIAVTLGISLSKLMNVEF